MKSILLIFVIVIKISLQDLQDDIQMRLNGSDGEILRRHRRYLTFPEGSSLQLVFCFTMPSLGVGQIFTVGNTVALAWELPKDPFIPFQRASERIDTNNNINNNNNNIVTKPIAGSWTMYNVKSPVNYMKTYYNPFIINKPPTSSNYIGGHNTNHGAFYSAVGPKLISTVDNKWAQRNDYRISQQRTMDINNKNYNNNKMYTEPITTYIHPVYHQVYRRTRRSLYTKIEKLFTALSTDGRACLLKLICQVSKATQERGSFMEEIIKVIFRVRHYQDNSNEEQDFYDLAANKQHNCTEMYPNCKQSGLDGLFS